MAKFNVLKKYKDIELEKVLVPGDEVEMTVKRSNDIEKTLSDKGYKGPFLERIDKK